MYGYNVAGNRGDTIVKKNDKSMTNEDIDLCNQQNGHNGIDSLSECNNESGKSIEVLGGSKTLIRCENCNNKKLLITKDFFNTTVFDKFLLGLHINCLKELCLSNCEIEELPEAVTSLVNLCALDLSYNALSTIPDSCVLLTKLRTLNLSHNKIGDSAPKCLELGLSLISNLNLSNNLIYVFPRPKCVGFLQYLNLSSNNMNAPGWLFSEPCQNLIELDISHTYFFHYSFENKIIESKFRRTNFLKRVERLIVKNAFLSVHILHVLKHFQNLKCIDVGNDLIISKNERSEQNTILDLPLDMFYDIEKITEIYINNVRLSVLPSDLHLMKNLKVLHAARNIISWLPDCFTKLGNLEILNLSSNMLLYLPTDFNLLVNIRELYLSHNMLNDIQKAVMTLTNLEVLDLFNNRIEVLPVSYDQLRRLVKCDLEWNYMLTDTSLRHTYEDGLDALVVYRTILKNLRTDLESSEFRLAGRCPKLHSDNSGDDFSDESSETSSSLSEDNNYENEDFDKTMQQKSETEENWDEDVDQFHPCNYIPAKSCKELPITKPRKRVEYCHIDPEQFEDAD